MDGASCWYLRILNIGGWLVHRCGQVTKKAFQFPKKHNLPFYFVSAADGTNVVKVWHALALLVPTEEHTIAQFDVKRGMPRQSDRQTYTHTHTHTHAHTHTEAGRQTDR